jgi:capsular exopolysaccharide synthesis family protein
MNLQIQKLGLSNFSLIMKRRRFLIFSIVLIVVVLVMIGTLASPSLYRTKAQIIIERKSPNVSPFPELYALQSTQKDYYQTQYKILQSRALADQVLASLIKQGVIKRKDKVSRLKLLRMITILPLSRSWLVDIQAVGPDPRLVKALADTWAKQYIRYTFQTKLNTIEDALEQLRAQLKSQAARLKEARQKLQEYKELYQLSSLEERQNVEVRRLDDINKLLTQSQRHKLEMETKLQQLKIHLEKGLPLATFPLVQKDNLIRNLTNQYITLQTKYADSHQRYQPRHPLMIQLQAQLDTMEKKINEESQKIIKGVKSECEMAAAEEKEIKKQLREQKTTKLELDRKSINYLSLKEKVTSAQKIYEALLSRLNETDFYKNIDVTNIRLLERAPLPRRPFRPRKMLNFLISIFAGLFLGVGAALVVERLDDTVKTPEDIKHYLKLPVIASIPLFTPKNKPDDGILIYSHPHTHITEAFRALRTTLLINAPRKTHQTILITSAAPSEGKSLISLQLAATLAQVQERVLLIDSDMRKPNLHKLMGKTTRHGLSDYLNGEADLEEIVFPTAYSNLSVIFAGKLPSNPSELLSSPRFSRLLQETKDRWDRVVFDSPPLLSVTDSSIIATVVDGVIQIIRTYQNSWMTALQGKEILKDMQANILGVVLNGVEWGTSYYYYQTYYGYGQYDNQDQPV